MPAPSAPVLPAPYRGLSAPEVARRLGEHGPDAVPEPAPPRLWTRIASQLRDPLVLVLLASMVVTLALRDIADALVIALVVRDGARQVVAADQVVPGDLVLLAAGDVVPADLDLVEAVRLRLDEAALTGESVPSTRRWTATTTTARCSRGRSW